MSNKKSIPKLLFTKHDSDHIHWNLLAHILIGRVIIFTFLLLTIPLFLTKDYASFIFFAMIVILSNGLFTFWLQESRSAKWSTPLQFVIDIIVVTGFVHLTGGFSSYLCLLYPFVILASAIIVSGKLSLFIGSLSCVAYATIILLEYKQILSIDNPIHNYESSFNFLMVLLLRCLVLALFSIACNSIISKYKREKKERGQYSTLCKLIVSNASTPIVIIEESGEILFSNNAAEKFLVLNTRKLGNFNSFFKNEFSIEDTLNQDRIWEMIKRDGKHFWASLGVSSAKLPMALLSDAGVDEKKYAYIIALYDMTRILKVEQETYDSTKLKTTLDMASEIGHWVRNPITSIKVACDLIQSTMEDKANGDQDFSQKDMEMMFNMYHIIAKESQRLETKIDEFLHSSDENHMKLLRLMDEAGSWSDRLKLFESGTYD